MHCSKIACLILWLICDLIDDWNIVPLGRYVGGALLLYYEWNSIVGLKCRLQMCSPKIGIAMLICILAL